MGRMIARLEGKVLEHEGDAVVIDCSGVGYGVRVCHDEQSSLTAGQTYILYISEQIKEDAHELFGFSQKSRRQLFNLLLSVSGVGPKAAMAILNVGSEAEVRSAIASGDTKFISAAVGVGKKVAERVVVDLKNKVGLGDDPSATDWLAGPNEQDEAVQALISLGHSPSDASQLLAKVDPKLPTTERVKKALSL